jgi:hypothetical protein
VPQQEAFPPEEWQYPGISFVQENLCRANPVTGLFIKTPSKAFDAIILLPSGLKTVVVLLKSFLFFPRSINYISPFCPRVFESGLKTELFSVRPVYCFYTDHVAVSLLKQSF